MRDSGGNRTPRLLIVDDDERFCRVLQASLEQEGYEPVCAGDCRQAEALFRQAPPDLVILDVLLPDADGWEMCRRLRTQSQVPIIFLTARGGHDDVIRGLDQGGDDYMVKPVDLAELTARIGAMLRRVGEGDAPPRVYDDGVLRIDSVRHAVHKRGREVALSPKEFQLLAALVRHAGQVVSHAQLLAEVWGPGYEGEIDYLRLYIRYLRAKLEDDPAAPRYIRTHTRAGYRFAPEADG